MPGASDAIISELSSMTTAAWQESVRILRDSSKASQSGIRPSTTTIRNSWPASRAFSREIMAARPLPTADSRMPHLLHNAAMTRWLGPLWSTISIGTSINAGTRSSADESGTCCAVILTVKWKVLPLPTALSSQIRPPIKATSCDEIARPSPVPPYVRVVLPSAWANASKIVYCFSEGIPIPLSSTVKRNSTSRFVSASDCTETKTSPRCVNLTALPIRLTRIWRNRSASPTRYSTSPLFWCE